MRYQEYSPHASLRDYLKCFWILERDYTPEDPNEEVIPDACIELIFNFSAPYVLQAAGLREREMSAAFLIGLQNKPLLFRSRGTVKIVAALTSTTALAHRVCLTGFLYRSCVRRHPFNWRQ